MEQPINIQNQLKNVVSIVAAIVVTAIVVGGGIYLWQKNQPAANVSAPTSLTVGSFSFDCSGGDTFCEFQPGRLVEEIKVMGQLRTTEDEIAQVVYYKENFQEVEKYFEDFNDQKVVERKNIGENKLVVVKPLPWVVDYFVYSTIEEDCMALHFRGRAEDSPMLDRIVQTVKYTRACNMIP